MYSPRIEKAIHTAADLHRGQKRKGDAKLPYISHLISVALIVEAYTDDEDVFIAALLHDILEDTDYTPEALERDFGTRVARIVEGVTEPQDVSTWEEKKRGYVKGLRNAPEESLLVSAADKIHNFSMSQFSHNLDTFKRDFRGSIKDRRQFYKAIVETISARLSNPIVKELQKSFTQYDSFLQQL